MLHLLVHTNRDITSNFRERYKQAISERDITSNFRERYNKQFQRIYVLPTLCLSLNRGRDIDFQRCGILTSVDSDKPVQSPLSLETPTNLQSVAKHS